MFIDSAIRALAKQFKAYVREQARLEKEEQTKTVINTIKDKNADILKMSDAEILNDPKIKYSMNIDATGLKIGEPIKFNKYADLSDKEFVKKAGKFNRIYGKQAGATIIDVRKVFSTYKGKDKRSYIRQMKDTLGIDPRGITRFDKIDRLRGRARLDARDRREEIRRRREKEEEK